MPLESEFIVPDSGWELGDGAFAWVKLKNEKTKDDIPLGFEYEYESRQGINVLSRCKPQLIPYGFHMRWEDFSEEGEGIEIKSPVAPLSIQRRYHKGFMDGFNFSPIHANQTEGGIHVHLERSHNTVSIANIYKIQYFLYQYKLACRKLSERRQDLYEKWCQHYPFRNRDSFNADKWAQLTGCYDTYSSWYHCSDKPYVRSISDHCCVLNIERSQTVEFRLFAAHPTLVMPALEMAEALFVTAKKTRSQLMRWDQFIDTVKSTNRYKNLWKHIKKHDLKTAEITGT